MIEVDIDRLVGEGDIRLNATVLGGDIITVGARKKSFVYVLGYVQTPGSFEIEESARIDALQAVARAGGLAAAARAQNSFLVTERGGARRIIDVDLTKIARGVRPPVHMVPGDTLIVGSGFFAKLGEFIKPSVGVGASLAPVP
jgi:protein involved in polysaccharide export with SLBB domain